ncbi:MAG: methyltransferase domain-containing protein [Chloroflexota bacterium]|nr:methyltransferase domain-containing protein [Chloroflexota bacterium]MDE2941598.1 methyltransferase domain-containing protein [Chloroflexota bacterium]MDE3267217.1 methyltransferase domain-containing protein [Chloroflexota bacterium]
MEQSRSQLSGDFWQEKPATVGGMLLQDDVPGLGQAERDEILAQLPPLEGKDILELGAGIGRYTSHFVTVARHVTAVDFVERFLVENRQTTAAFDNVTYHCANVLDMEFEAGSFDFVFWNWLLMYLGDSDITVLRDMVRSWMRVGGVLFFRESCFPGNAGVPPSPDNPATYRPADLYTSLFGSEFKLLRKDNVKAYEQLLNRSNQNYWLFQRTG